MADSQQGNFVFVLDNGIARKRTIIVLAKRFVLREPVIPFVFAQKSPR
jgi:hypothetical protein